MKLSKILSGFLPNTTTDIVTLVTEESITSSNILSSGKVQILDVAGNIIKKYDSNKLPEDTKKMIMQEVAKGYAIYVAGEYAKKKRVPAAIIITTQVGIIILDNLHQNKVGD